MADYRVLSAPAQPTTDADEFIRHLGARQALLPPALQPFFRPAREIVIARAPGRLDLMGGIADYSGSLVLEMPIARATFVALQRDPDRFITIATLPPAAGSEPRTFRMPLSDFMQGATPAAYHLLRQRFALSASDRWASYVAGACLVLMRERSFSFPEGARLLVDSAVPVGAGLASSAALEVAAMQAIAVAFGIRMPARDLGLRCQQVENLIAGAPCGVMDQLTSAAGIAGHLVEILCQPADLEEPLPLPEELGVWGLDSGVRHQVSGATYGTIRTAAFMGYRIIADMVGLPVRDLGNGHVKIDDPDWDGYLANIKPRFFEDFYAGQLPHQMPGAQFLRRYQGITDPVTEVHPDMIYPVFAATRHPVYEHARVSAFSATLKSWRGLEQASLLGGLMYQSHDSYTACGLGVKATDAIVDLVRAIGPAGGLYGAKATGGGSGGAVAILGHRDAEPSVYAVAERYADEMRLAPLVVAGSSPGATAFGHARVIEA